jgi:hypothetical protein
MLFAMVRKCVHEHTGAQLMVLLKGHTMISAYICTWLFSTGSVSRMLQPHGSGGLHIVHCVCVSEARGTHSEC